MSVLVLAQNTGAIKMPISMERHRFHLLDAMRGLAAMLVVTYHLPPFFKQYSNFPGAFLSVDFFFCLSGFVIAFSYENRLKQQMKMREFAVVRLIRLYPLYALGSLISIVRGLHVSAVYEQVHSKSIFALLLAFAIFLIPNFVVSSATKLYPFDYPAWSLFFELAANLLYAALVRMRAAAKMLPGVCATCLAVLLWVALHRPTLDTGWSTSTVGIGLARVGFSFSAGVFLLHLYRSRPGHRLSGTKAWIGSAVAVGLLLTALIYRPIVLAASIYELLVISILFPALVYLGAICSLPANVNAFFAFLGNASYPLYMLHVPLMLPFYDKTHGPLFLVTHTSQIPWLVLIFVLFLAIVSWAVGNFFDEPVRRWLTFAYRRFQGGSQHV